MTTEAPKPATGCSVCEYFCGGYCGNANPRCPNRPDSAPVAPAGSPASKPVPPEKGQRGPAR